jgi:plasmid stability protein
MRKGTIEREIELEEREILRDKFLTEMRKTQFVNELKAGLGDEIKNNPRGIKIIKEPRYKRFMTWLKSFFTKF